MSSCMTLKNQICSSPKGGKFYAVVGRTSPLITLPMLTLRECSREFPEATEAWVAPDESPMPHVLASSPRCAAGASQSGRSASVSRPTSSHGGPRSSRTSWRSVAGCGGGARCFQSHLLSGDHDTLWSHFPERVSAPYSKGS